MRTGLVLEGGGMRGLYTVGVLDALMKENIYFDYVIGASAGASNGISYVSGQWGRSYRINTNYLKDKRYLSLNNFFETQSLFGMEFIFEEIPDRLDPFNYEAFHKSPMEFVAVVTDAQTGKPYYFNKEHMSGNSEVVKASAAIPALSPPVTYAGHEYYDGGVSDPIPFQKALDDGCDCLVIVLTRPRSFVKGQEPFQYAYKRALADYPNVIKTMDERQQIYTMQQARIRELEEQGKAIVLAPSDSISVTMIEKNLNRLNDAYNAGTEDLIESLPKISEMFKARKKQ